MTREAPAASGGGGRPTAVADGDDDDDGFKSVGRGGKTMLFTAEGIFKNLQAVQEARGKKVPTLNLPL